MKFLTKKEVAGVLRVNECVVDNYIRNGMLVATKPGGKVLIEQDDLRAFVDGGRIVSGPIGSPGSLV